MRLWRMIAWLWGVTRYEGTLDFLMWLYQHQAQIDEMLNKPQPTEPHSRTMWD